MPVKRPVRERFFEKLRRDGDCLVWTGYRDKCGYGRMAAGSAATTKLALTHRVAWFLQNGPIPDGMQVLHKCDNPPCVDHTHLFLGTHGDNMRDCVEKGRHADGTGEANNFSKLTEDDVRDIRPRATNRNGAAMALEYGISPGNVSHIITRKSWSHVK